jgi:hypothetical protein
MGRFDALTKLDEKEPQKKEKQPVGQSPSSLLSDTTSVTPQPHTPTGMNRSPDGKKPPIQQTSKAVKQSPADLDKVEKYTTHLEPSLIKKIKLAAVEKDMKDYDVVRAALIQYFENNT